MQTFLRRPIALPQDHGSWVFLFSPLVIGLFAGKEFTPVSLAVVIGALAAFLIRQPVTMAVKAYSGRRSRSDLPAARFWMILYGTIGLLAAGELIHLGFFYILYLAIPAIPVFAWHLYLVGKRAERRQAGVEILATGVLALAAPAAYWAGTGSHTLASCSDGLMLCPMTPNGWWLWLLTWLQSAASIVYAYLRLEQREWTSMPAISERFRAGSRALAYTTFNVLLCLGLGFFHLLPGLIFTPFLLQWVETLWGASHPAIGAKPVAIGMRQLVVSTLFTILFIATWG